MERKKLRVILIPQKCVDCTKENMEAVYCPDFPTLENELAEVVHCATIGGDKNKLVKSGGRFNHSWKNLKPDSTKSASIPGGSRVNRKSASN